MPIDDPTSALQSLNDSEDRQRSPISKYAKQFLRAVKLFCPGGELPLAAVEAASEWVGRREEENRKELVDVIAQELQYRGNQIDILLAESGEHRRFMEEEMPALLLDALRRAEQTRAKDRIRRLGHILVNAAEVGHENGADYVEDLMKVALELSHRDLLVLKEASAEFDRQQRDNHSEAPTMIAARIWLAIPWPKLGVPSEQAPSIGARLQSFGLASRIEGISGDRNSYIVLQRGKDLLQYLQSCAEGQ
jgi:hypothetical protein